MNVGIIPIELIRFKSEIDRNFLWYQMIFAKKFNKQLILFQKLDDVATSAIVV
jgi:hypothetical protein